MGGILLHSWTSGGGGSIHVAERDNADVRRGAGGGSREQSSTICTWRAHTKLCRTHETQVFGQDKAFWRWCWMGYRRERGEAGTSTGSRRFKQLRGKDGGEEGVGDLRGGRGGQGERDQTTCKKEQI